MESRLVRGRETAQIGMMWKDLQLTSHTTSIKCVTPSPITRPSHIKPSRLGQQEKTCSSRERLKISLSVASAKRKSRTPSSVQRTRRGEKRKRKTINKIKAKHSGKGWKGVVGKRSQFISFCFIQVYSAERFVGKVTVVVGMMIATAVTSSAGVGVVACEREVLIAILGEVAESGVADHVVLTLEEGGSG